jgi:hypothetical protein
MGAENERLRRYPMLAGTLGVCYKFVAEFRLTTSAFHQFSCARN